MYSLIVLAAGLGKRTGLDTNKVFYKINGKPLISYVLETFKHETDCKETILVCHEDDYELMQALYNHEIDIFVIGGKTRQESVYNGLKKASNSYVFIHDGARGFVNKAMLDRIKTALKKHPSVTPVVKLVDTIYKLKEGFLDAPLERDGAIRIQTPQAFERELIMKAHEKAHHTDKTYSCDASLLKDVLNVKTLAVAGDRRAIKFTTLEDIPLLELILK